MNKIYCSNCGNHVGVDSKFCPYCGAAQHGQAAATFRAQAPALKPEELTPQHAAPAEVPAHVPDTIKRQHLSPQAVWSFFFNYTAATSILLLLLVIGTFVQPVVAGSLLVAYLVVTFLAATVIHNSYTYEISQNGFKKDYGVVHKRHVSIPFQQVQNVNINRSLVDRMLGIAKIDIETAGGSHITPRGVIGGTKTKAEGYLPGVSLPDAMVIHDLLLHRAAQAQGAQGTSNHVDNAVR